MPRKPKTVAEALQASGLGELASALKSVERSSNRVRKQQERRSRRPPTITSYKPPPKPSFETAVRAKRGDRVAQRQVNLWIKRQKAIREQEARVQAMTDRALFGEAESTIKGAAKTAHPAIMALTEALSPTTAMLDTLRAARKGEVGPAAVSALGLLPVGRGPSAAEKAAKAVRAGEKAEAAAAEAAAVRSLKLGEKVQQLPRGRSRVRRNLIDKPADFVSRAMMGEGRIARGSRRIPGQTASADKRVARHAGREAAQERRRAVDRMQGAIKEIGHEGTPEDAAHFWWAQLPENLRNRRGLKKVREEQARELEEVVSGRRGEELLRRKADLEEKLKNATGKARFALMERLGDVKVYLSDLPLLEDDISASIAQLDALIAKTPAYRPALVEAARTLSKDREQILIAAGKLDPDEAAAREGLLSRLLGEEGGGEVFVGHRSGKVPGTRSPGAPGVGRVRPPKGVGQKNRLILAKQGRLRPSLRVVVEDWQAAQGYRMNLRARDDLGQMGHRYTEGQRLAEDEMLVNPKGRAVPSQWRAAMASEDSDEIYKAAQAIKDSYITDEAGRVAALERWADEGVDWSELRVVKKDIVDRYYKQILPASPAGKAGKAYDTGVDFAAASIIFARVGYIPKNIVQNIVMSIPHQGLFFFVNAPRAAQVLKHPQLRHLFSGEVGAGTTSSLADVGAAGRVRGLPHTVASGVSNVADTPFRLSAFIHEAAAAKVIPKFSAHLSDKDVAALIDLATNPAKRPLLNDISARATDAMADFGRMNPSQRRMARRFLVIPAWLVAGSRYPFHFAASYPGRSAAMAYAAAGEPGAPEELQVNRPIDEYFAKGLPNFVEGIPTPWGVERTTSLSPVSTPWEIANATANRGFRRAGDYANPMAVSLWNVLNSQAPGRNGVYKTDFWTAVDKNLMRVAPNAALVRDLANPPNAPRTYPEDSSRWGRAKREVGFLPIEIAREPAPEQKVADRVNADRLELEGKLRAAKVSPRVIRSAAKAWKLREKVYEARAQIDSSLEGADYQREALRVEYDLARRNGLRPRGGERALAFFAASPGARKKIIDGWDAENIEKLRRELSYYVFGGATIAAAREELN